MGFKIESTNDEIFSVGLPICEMMGLPGFPTLWILGSRYSDGSLGDLLVKFRWLSGGMYAALTRFVR